LKSLFKRLVNIQPEAARQVAVAEPPVNRKTAVAAHGAQADVAKTDARPGVNGTTASQAANTAPTRKVKLSNIGMTFSNLKKRSEEPAPVVEAETVAAQGDGDQHFTEDDLRREWLSMCMRMPQAMTGMAMRMKNMNPRLNGFPNVEVVVDNQILLNDITKIRLKIRNTLIQRLHNNGIELTLRLAKPEEIKPALTNRERFEELKTKNAAFGKLSDMLQLEMA